jgi:cytochrome P450
MKWFIIHHREEPNMATLSGVPERADVLHRQGWPGPRGNFLFGCLREFRRDQLNFLRDIWRTHGDYVRIPTISGYDVYFLADPAAIEHILVKNHKNYRKPEFLTGPVRLLLGNGLFISEGDFWLRQRRLAQPAFLRGAIVRLAAPMTTAVDDLLQTWETAPDGRTVDIVPEMMRLVLDIAAATLFGADVGDHADALGAAEREIFALVRHKMNNPLTAPLWVPTRLNRAYRRGKDLLDRVVLRVIESRRRPLTSTPLPSGERSRGEGEPAVNDLLSLLLAARDEESGTGMSDQQLRDEVVTLLFAGHDTTASALSWAWYLLARHPEAQESLHDEAAAYLGGRTPTADDLPHLPLATAVFEEAIRLYPPAPGLARRAVAPDEINGYPVPAKAILMPSQWVTHRHPAFWEEPDQFRPQRFLPGHTADRPKFAYFPFGGGPRVCIGNTFALIEGALVLSALAQRFQFQPADAQEVELDTTFVLRPKGAVNLVVRKRS